MLTWPCHPPTRLSSLTASASARSAHRKLTTGTAGVQENGSTPRGSSGTHGEDEPWPPVPEIDSDPCAQHVSRLAQARRRTRGSQRFARWGGQVSIESLRCTRWRRVPLRPRSGQARQTYCVRRCRYGPMRARVHDLVVTARSLERAAEVVRCAGLAHREARALAELGLVQSSAVVAARAHDPVVRAARLDDSLRMLPGVPCLEPRVHLIRPTRTSSRPTLSNP
jgi:hypothetical protein